MLPKNHLEAKPNPCLVPSWLKSHDLVFPILGFATSLWFTAARGPTTPKGPTDMHVGLPKYHPLQCSALTGLEPGSGPEVCS